MLVLVGGRGIRFPFKRLLRVPLGARHVCFLFSLPVRRFGRGDSRNLDLLRARERERERELVQ